MSVTVTCECTNTFSLKDEYAGRVVKCPNCGRSVRAGDTTFTPESQADPVFGRDVFLLRQQALRINERYDVTDQGGQPILFVERPAHFLRNVGAMLAALASAFVWLTVMTAIADGFGTGALGNVFSIIGVVGMIPLLAVVGMTLSKKRHVSFFTGQDKTNRVLEVLQDKKIAFINATYTVRDAQGTPLALFRKNYLFNFFRRKWEVQTPDGQLQWVAREDSIILSLVRRFVPLMGLIRTNFIFQPAGSDKILAEFKRKMTILDRYVLDLSADRNRTLDRRVAVALAVMLDTGERR
ncbi:MAG TPA: hypothetical protein VJT85_00900 [Gemmatimonadaceae bacterium]|nr:hypothetical protein [Gemmatimonadaceae bacterium]